MTLPGIHDRRVAERRWTPTAQQENAARAIALLVAKPRSVGSLRDLAGGNTKTVCGLVKALEGEGLVRVTREPTPRGKPPFVLTWTQGLSEQHQLAHAVARTALAACVEVLETLGDPESYARLVAVQARAAMEGLKP